MHYKTFAFIVCLLLALLGLNMYTCDLCYYQYDSFSEFRNHYVRKHKNDPNFHVRCCIGNCAYSTKKWNCFRVHVHRKHKDEVDVYNGDNIPVHAGDELDIEENQYEPMAPHMLRGLTHQSALYALTLESKYNLAYNEACNNILTSTSELVKMHDEYLRTVMIDNLRQRDVDDTLVDGIPLIDTFSELSNQADRNRVYEQLPVFVKPFEVVLRTITKRKRGELCRFSEKVV